MYLSLRRLATTFWETVYLSSPCFGTALNNKGQVVGQSSTTGRDHAFLWDKGVMIDLGSFAGGLSSASGINDRSEVVGFSATLLGDSPFLWRAGTMIDLGSLSQVDHEGAARAINNQSEVVGYSFARKADGTTVQHAFVWQEQFGMLDLNNLLDASGAGWRLVEAKDVNDEGQIVGYGFDAQGRQRAFLLNPVPIPSSLWLLGSGAMVWLVYRGACLRGRPARGT
jgi:probable HAF family extracellular repeat protein